MSGTVAERKRLLCVTPGNIKHKHLYLSKHADFFPTDAIGKTSSRNGNGRNIEEIEEFPKADVVAPKAFAA